MKPFKLIVVAVIGLFWTLDSAGQIGLNKLAQSTMNFQLVSLSAKASAMGEAFYTIGTGAESMFYNPAGLAGTARTVDAAFHYTQWIGEVNYLGGAVAYNMGMYGTVGMSLLSVDYGTIYGAQLDPSATSPTGYIETGVLNNVGAYSVGLSYARAINANFSMGGSGRYVAQNLGENTFIDGTGRKNKASKLIFDAGVKYDTHYKGFAFGMAIRNFSSNIQREEIAEQMPLTFTMGAAFNAWDFISESAGHDLIVAVDFLHSNSYSERINLGAEYSFMGMLALRAGYQTNRDIASWSAGVGFHTSLSSCDLEISYAFSKMELFDNVNRFSVNLGFPRRPSK